MILGAAEESSGSTSGPTACNSELSIMSPGDHLALNGDFCSGVESYLDAVFCGSSCSWEFHSLGKWFVSVWFIS